MNFIAINHQRMSHMHPPNYKHAQHLGWLPDDVPLDCLREGRRQ